MAMTGSPISVVVVDGAVDPPPELVASGEVRVVTTKVGHFQ